MIPKLINEPPSTENTIPYYEFQSSSPENFIDDDKLVLFAGGTNFLVKVLPPDGLTTVTINLHVTDIFQHPVSLFVLNTSLIIYNRHINQGLEIPYQMIVLHALKLSGTLYLQIASNALLTSVNQLVENEPIVELELESPGNDHHDYDDVFVNIPNLITDVYQGMAKCSSMHYDEDDDDIIPGADQPSWDGWVESGDGDDLDDVAGEEFKGAGMDVNVGHGPVAGIKRKETEVDGAKKPRIN